MSEQLSWHTGRAFFVFCNGGTHFAVGQPQRSASVEPAKYKPRIMVSMVTPSTRQRRCKIAHKVQRRHRYYRRLDGGFQFEISFKAINDQSPFVITTINEIAASSAVTAGEAPSPCFIEPATVKPLLACLYMPIAVTGVLAAIASHSSSANGARVVSMMQGGDKFG